MSSETATKITFVSAGAGSGKTHRLTELLHEELVSGRVRPSGLIATTFTRDAATELRKRVREHLLNKGEFDLAIAIEQSWIGTVNSVAGDLVRRFAFEAGFSPDQQVLDEVQAELILAKAIDAELDSRGISELQLVARNLGLDEDWKKDLKRLVEVIRGNDIPAGRVAGFGQRNADDLLGYFPTPTTEDLDRLLLQAIQGCLPEVEAKAASGGKGITKEYLRIIRSFSETLLNAKVQWSDWVKLSKEKPEVALKDTTKSVAQISGRFAEHGGLHNDLRRYLELMFALVSQVLTSYATIKAEMGALDFTDQEHKLLTLLDRQEVTAVLEEELDLLMVDEFQDTSPIQLAIFLKLVGVAKRVIWVGDIKQSIFEFRGSDAKLMSAVLENLPRMGGTKDVLRYSWRSRADIVSVVNAVFTEAFSTFLPPEEIALEAKRSNDLRGPAVANWVLSGGNLDLEASALARGIHRLIESSYAVFDKETGLTRPVAFRDFAILARTGAHTETLIRNLSQCGIPVASANAGLLKTPEAVLALACLSRLNDPRDTVSTAVILSMVDGMEPESWVTDRLNYLQSGEDRDSWKEQSTEGHEAHPILAKIAGMRRILSLFGPREALESVIATCQLSEVIVRWNRNEGRARKRLANLEALITLAKEYEEFCESGQHAASISGLLLWLGELAAKDKDNLAKPAINAVTVLTNHRAKGLEWPVVILTDLHSNIRDRLWSVSAQSDSEFNAADPLRDRYIRYWPWPFGKQKRVALVDQISRERIAVEFRRAAVDESKRLLYVGMTRARDLLILARSSRNPTGEWIDILQAPWLLPDGTGDFLQLPSGEKIQSEKWDLNPIESNEFLNSSPARAMHWFPTVGAQSVRLPLRFTPSQVKGCEATVIEKCLIGKRLSVASGTDSATLGSALHDCLALSFSDRRVPITESEVQRILAAYKLDDEVHSSEIYQQIEAFHFWIKERWPEAVPYAEITVQSVLESGQILNGRIDLLLDTQTGWILIDHKSSQLAQEHWNKLAFEHGTQLASYEKAIEQASKRKVLESWIYLPVAGGGIRVLGVCLPA